MIWSHLQKAVSTLTAEQQRVAMDIVHWLAEQPATASDKGKDIVREIERRLDAADISTPDRLRICVALFGDPA